MSERYLPVRALSRGLRLLNALSRIGPATAAQLATAADVDRTTAYRLLETLRREGFIVLNVEDKRYSLSAIVRQIADGFTDSDLTSQVVGSELGRLLTLVKWPSDFAIFDMGSMVIRESTHRFSLYSIHRAMIGRSRPLLRSALGRAALAVSTPEDRDQMVELALNTGQLAADGIVTRKRLEAIVENYHRLGYAQSVDGSEKGISAIALPVRGPTNIFGALNIVFFTSAMTPAEAADKYLVSLRETVANIEAKLRTTTPCPMP